MRILHTGDWHLGKVLRGRSRAEEQAAVLAEIVQLAERERVHLVIVAGDVFETAAPSPDAQRLAWSTLLALRATGAEVVVVAGNHDNAHAFDAVRPVFSAAGIHVHGTVARPGDGGLLELSVGGERARVAVLPWVSPRQVLRAGQLLELDAAELGLGYADRVHRVLGALTAGMGTGPPAVELAVVHAFVRGGVLGGGERDAQTVNDYGISAGAFPPGASYVALGHLHRTQRIPGPCPIWYSGSPFAVDFGEEADDKGVLLVEATAGRPAVVEARPISAAVRLRTVRGTLAELAERAEHWRDDLLRVVITEPGRAGLADSVRAALPNALEVRIERPVAAGASATAAADRHTRGPQESFAEYLADQGVEDARVVGLFAELLAEELSDDADEPGDGAPGLGGIV